LGGGVFRSLLGVNDGLLESEKGLIHRGCQRPKTEGLRICQEICQGAGVLGK
jgi:hypothetical protein